MKERVCFETLAESIYFTGYEEDVTPKEYKVEFRKGRDIEDVKIAISKSISRGKYKTEWEIEWLALYLKSVFKLYKSA